MPAPSYRADSWAALKRDPSLTPAELARRTYSSFSTAWEVALGSHAAGGFAVTAEPLPCDARIFFFNSLGMEQRTFGVLNVLRK